MKRIWAAQPGKEKAQGKFMASFNYKKRARKSDRGFVKRHIGRGQGVVASD